MGPRGPISAPVLQSTQTESEWRGWGSPGQGRLQVLQSQEAWVGPVAGETWQNTDKRALDMDKRAGHLRLGPQDDQVEEQVDKKIRGHRAMSGPSVKQQAACPPGDSKLQSLRQACMLRALWLHGTSTKFKKGHPERTCLSHQLSASSNPSSHAMSPHDFSSWGSQWLWPGHHSQAVVSKAQTSGQSCLPDLPCPPQAWPTPPSHHHGTGALRLVSPSPARALPANAYY